MQDKHIKREDRAQDFFEKLRGIFGQSILHALLPFLGLVAIVAIFAWMTDGRLIKDTSIDLILSQVYVLMITCTGVFMIMTVGALDFSQGSILGLASIVISYLSFYSIPLAIFAGIVAGACIGRFQWFLLCRFKIPSFIVTICTMYLFRGACAYLTTDAPVAAVTSITSLNTTEFKVILTIAVLLIVFLVFRFTKLGITLKAVGAGERARALFRYPHGPDQVSRICRRRGDYGLCSVSQRHQGRFDHRDGGQSVGNTDPHRVGVGRAAHIGRCEGALFQHHRGYAHFLRAEQRPGDAQAGYGCPAAH